MCSTYAYVHNERNNIAVSQSASIIKTGIYTINTPSKLCVMDAVFAPGLKRRGGGGGGGGEYLDA